MSEEYILRWNNFHSILSAGCYSFLENGDLADVTLSVEGSSIPAHKLILSVFSPYFRQIFKETPASHPIVILKDVALHDLNSLLQFMYKGEVSVSRRNIGSLMNTAALLEVKGLTIKREMTDESDEGCSVVSNNEKTEVSSNNLESDEDKKYNERKRLLPNNVTSPVRPSKKRAKSESSNNEKSDKEDVSVTPVNGHVIEQTQPALKTDICNNISSSPDTVKESTGTEQSCKAVNCPHCPRMFVNRYNLKVHIRDKHSNNEGTLKCPICSKLMRNQSCLRVHVHKHKKEALNTNEPITNGSATDVSVS